MKLKLFLALVLLLFSTLSNAASAPTGPGELDGSFGGFSSDGVVNITGMTATDVDVQSDGKIVVAGINNTDIVIKRYYPNGAVDSSFGSGGTTTLSVNFTWGTFGGLGLAIQPTDDRIVLAGSTSSTPSDDFFVLRLSANGVMDGSFGLNGIQTIDFDGNDDYASDVAVQSDGSIVVAGYGYSDDGAFGFADNDFAIARLDEAGNLDSTFAGDGKRFVEFGETGVENDFAFDLLVQLDSKIVVVGSEESDFSGREFAIIRLNKDGSLDDEFDGDGKRTFDLDDDDYAYAVAMDLDWRLIMVGRSTDLTGPNKIALARLNEDGSLDSSFDGDGKRTIDLVSSSHRATNVVVDEDNRWTILVTIDDSDGRKMRVMRFLEDGSADTSFGTDGNVNIPKQVNFRQNDLMLLPDSSLLIVVGDRLIRLRPNGDFDTSGETISGTVRDETAYDVAIQPDGKIIVVGSTTGAAGTRDPIVARYDSDGTIDATFGNVSGFQILNRGNDDEVYAVTLQPDGKIVMAGYRVSSDADFAVFRLNPDGSNDTSFSGDGLATVDLGGDDYAKGLALLPDGKIVVAGTSPLDSSTLFAVARFNSDGSLDTNFGANGVASVTIGSGFVDMRAMVVLYNGKFLLGGGHSGDFVLARFTASGSKDFSFGPNGTGVYRIEMPNNDVIQTMGVLSDGRVALVGYSSGQWATMVLNPSGTLCPCGITDYRLLTSMGASAIPRDLIIQEDGKILVVGSHHNSDVSTSEFLIARYLYEAATPRTYELDTTFGLNGIARHEVQTPAFGRGVALDADNGIIVAGDVDNGHDTNLALIRLVSDVVTPPTTEEVTVYLPLIQK